MDSSTINSISTIVFLAITGLFFVVSGLTAYVFIRYGQKRPYTILVSLIFFSLFLVGVVTAFFNLQSLF